MPIPQHTIHVYQRPAQGSSFLKRYPVYNYQHSISNQGWFDTASCDLAIRSASEGNDILNGYLGAFVQIYVDNPVVPIWEGLINRITFNAGGASYTISLDEMANRVSVVYTGAANAAGQTTIANNTNSQAIFGIKQDQIEFGTDTTPGPASQRGHLRDTIIAQRAFPQTAISQAQGETNLVHLELIGIFHTLEWEKQFTVLTTGSNTATTKINATLAALANGTTFFNSADTSQVDTNAITIPDQQRGISTWELIQKIAESGDATNYWIAGILPTDPNLGTRRLYYRQFNSTVEYTALQADSLKPRNAYGQPIAPWLIVPDRSIRVTDTLVGFGSSIVSDPRVTYIQSVEYDANSQSVQWFGADDTTARAAFHLKRRFKPLGKNMPGSAPLRTIAT
jgi:hypothetical protein